MKLTNCSDDSAPSLGSRTNPAEEARVIDAHLSWEWKPSDLKWLDSGVSSEIVEFPQGIKVTDKNTIFALHRVKGCPSQFPFYHQRAAFLVDFTNMDHVDPEKTVDSILRDQVKCSSSANHREFTDFSNFVPGRSLLGRFLGGSQPG